MNRGKWYITFTWHNDFEPRGGTIEIEEILLDATTEEEAIAKAPVKLKEWIEVAKANWEKLGKIWSQPKPGSRFAPLNYNVIYKITIK